MEALLGLALLWTSVQVSRTQCVLEKEYFCSSIPKGFPEGLTSILFVVTNLGVINSTVFNNPNLASITSLALANSGITKIEPGAFHAFQSLTKLSLYQNSLYHVTSSWLSNPQSLENLTVAQNFITQIGPSMFSGLSNLTTLNLANNRIHDVAVGSFKDLSKLKFLDLSGNRLTTLRRTVFHGLTTLPAMKLGSNPWNCSCELQDFGLFLQEMINASLLEDAPSIVCHAPPNFQGVHVWNISRFNCSPDFLSSALGDGFHKVGLPALLACIVFISLLVLLFWIWMVKHDDKQVQPSKEVVDSTLSTKSVSRVDSIAERQQSNPKFKTSERGTTSRNLMEIRAKSASAILLRTEFYQKQSSSFDDTKWDHLRTMPYVSLDDKMYIGSEDFQNFMEVQNYQKLEEGNREDFQNRYNVSSFLTEVSIETPKIKVDAETAKPTQEGHGSSRGLKGGDVKGCESAENPEPFLYLSIATAPKVQADVNSPKEMLPKTGGNHSISLKRTLTWPYERTIWEQGANVLSIRGSFRAQLFMASPPLGGTQNSEKKDGEEWNLQKGHESAKHEFKQEAKLDNEKHLEDEREPKVEGAEETTGDGKSEFEVKQRENEQACSRKEDRMDHSGAESNAEWKSTNHTEFLVEKEPEAATIRRYTRSSKSGATKYPTDLKSKQFPKPVSSHSGNHHAIRPSPRSSVDPRSSVEAATTSSSFGDEASLENNDDNYMNLLHEVVENRGRWTRERWKQNRRTHSVHPSACKSK